MPSTASKIKTMKKNIPLLKSDERHFFKISSLNSFIRFLKNNFTELSSVIFSGSLLSIYAQSGDCWNLHLLVWCIWQQI